MRTNGQLCITCNVNNQTENKYKPQTNISFADFKEADT